MKTLMKKIGYQFKNENLLRQALTRQSAVHEAVAAADSRDYQALEVVGDAQIKAVLSILILEKNPLLTAEELNAQLVPLIANTGVMIPIAGTLTIDSYLIKGAGETHITDKMRVDAVEAIIGAVALDSKNNKKGPLALYRVIQKLWAPYVPCLTPVAKVAASSSKSKPKPKPVSTVLITSSFGKAAPQPPLSPATQRVFTSTNYKYKYKYKYKFKYECMCK